MSLYSNGLSLDQVSVFVYASCRFAAGSGNACAAAASSGKGVAIFAVVITVFMGAGHSALAFIYDSQKGNKRLGERG